MHTLVIITFDASEGQGKIAFMTNSDNFNYEFMPFALKDAGATNQ